MPHYLIKEKNKTGILVHEAPLDEKTKELRQRFDVDEETGYPRQYNWRALARLGPNYRPEKIYEVFEPYTQQERLSTRIALAGTMAIIVGSGHVVTQKWYARPVWSKPLPAIAVYVAFTTAALWMYDKKFERQQLKNQIYADYMKKHPERFETVHRPKFRECLFHYTPIR